MEYGSFKLQIVTSERCKSDFQGQALFHQDEVPHGVPLVALTPVKSDQTAVVLGKGEF